MKVLVTGGAGYIGSYICKALARQGLGTFDRYRRGVVKWRSGKKPFAERRYFEQKRLDFYFIERYGS